MSRMVSDRLYKLVHERKPGRIGGDTQVSVGESLLHVFFHGNEIFRMGLETGNFIYDFCGYTCSPATMARINCCLAAVGAGFSLFRRNFRICSSTSDGRTVELDGRMDGRDVASAMAVS